MTLNKFQFNAWNHISGSGWRWTLSFQQNQPQIKFITARRISLQSFQTRNYWVTNLKPLLSIGPNDLKNFQLMHETIFRALADGGHQVFNKNSLESNWGQCYAFCVRGHLVHGHKVLESDGTLSERGAPYLKNLMYRRQTCKVLRES